MCELALRSVVGRSSIFILLTLISYTPLSLRKEEKNCYNNWFYCDVLRRSVVVQEKPFLRRVAGHIYRLPSRLYGMHFCIYCRIFSARQHICYSALYAIACPSVCPFIRPSHWWISQRHLKLGSCNLHHRVAP